MAILGNRHCANQLYRHTFVPCTFCETETTFNTTSVPVKHFIPLTLSIFL